MHSRLEPAVVVKSTLLTTSSWWPVGFTNGSRGVVAFYLPGDLFGWSDQKRHSLSVESVTDATVLFLKRSALVSVAARESCVAAFVLEVTTRSSVVHRNTHC